MKKSEQLLTTFLSFWRFVTTRVVCDELLITVLLLVVSTRLSSTRRLWEFKLWFLHDLGSQSFLQNDLSKRKPWVSLKEDAISFKITILISSQLLPFSLIQLWLQIFSLYRYCPQQIWDPATYNNMNTAMYQQHVDPENENCKINTINNYAMLVTTKMSWELSNHSNVQVLNKLYFEEVYKKVCAGREPTRNARYHHVDRKTNKPQCNKTRNKILFNSESRVANGLWLTMQA